MTHICSFTVYGTPKPKGSVVKMANGRYLPAGSAKSRRETAEWIDLIIDSATGVMMERDRGLVIRPVRLGMRFMLYRAAKETPGYPHTKMPDLDKLARLVLDALTGIVYADDSQVAAIYASKVYAAKNNDTGVIITVDAIDGESATALARAGAAMEAMVKAHEYS